MDLLVDMASGRSLLDLVGLGQALEELLDRKVELRRLADEIEAGRAVPQVPYLDDFDDVPF